MEGYRFANKLPWSREEERFLKANAGKLSTAEIGTQLRRSEVSIRQKAYTMKVSMRLHGATNGIADELDAPVKEDPPKYRYIMTAQVPLHEFLSYKDHPGQRDTVTRAQEAEVLRTFQDRHLNVAIAMFEGEYYKVDGHTRVYMWTHGMVKNLPEHLLLNVEVYECDDLEAFNVLYDTFDSPTSVDRPPDYLFGAMRQAKLEFQSPLLKQGNFTNALKQLHSLFHSTPGTGLLEMTRLIEEYRDELVLYDQCNPTVKDFPASFSVASLLLFMRYGDEAKDFVSRYAGNLGIKTEDALDGVQAARNLRIKIRERKMSGRSHQYSLAGQFINAYESYRRGLMYVRVTTPRPMSRFNDFVRDAMRAKISRARKA